MSGIEKLSKRFMSCLCSTLICFQTYKTVEKVLNFYSSDYNCFAHPSDSWISRQLIIHFLIKSWSFLRLCSLRNFKVLVKNVRQRAVPRRELFFMIFCALLGRLSEKARHMTDIRWLTCRIVTDLTNAESMFLKCRQKLTISSSLFVPSEHNDYNDLRQGM